MNTRQHITHVVLTGGVGSRLWPLSRKSQPKQYLSLFAGRSLFELTVARNAALVTDVIIVGNAGNCHLSTEVMVKKEASYTHIIEATPRNTAAAIAFAAFASEPDDILVVTPSDHIIEETDLYERTVEEAIALAKNNYIVTFGIQPTKPEIGYGYIEFEGSNVLAFHEKPNIETAVAFIAQGNYLWNSGLFCFKAGLYLEELKKQEPELYKYSKIAWESNVDGMLDYDLSMQIPAISVDYAVMERSKNIRVVPSHFGWSDLGSFESVYEYLVKTGHPVDDKGNISIGSTIHTAFVGVENCLLVHSSDALLILQKEKSQDVKHVYQQLESVGSELI
ncbi:mannose-1-phosphate guanylyltransferase [Flavobacterium bomense]|uniref:Mannose-1-phosphate guanylyltransferase n=1 Tax=Flavobacterium bomense TaxID=2497483 RepID=A0A432CGI4_9FLAO|nr:mannose-1-phosphate guanylyltransferase [Flavobacterium bomense]RTZ02044.1 mannose-1-phosphate guanylyltransferase [Flavobacterium bomense]